MKQTIILGMSLLLTAAAQTNPKRGYVITNNGDTIRGVIEFATPLCYKGSTDLWD